MTVYGNQHGYCMMWAVIVPTAAVSSIRLLMWICVERVADPFAPG